jgi:hypothetical protein
MERPKEITVFGILCLVFACLGFLGLLMSLPLFLSDGPQANDPINKMLRESPGYLRYSKISVVVHALACLVLFGIGIGLLKARPWARRCAIGYGVYAVVAALIGNVVAAHYVYLPLLGRLDSLKGPEQFAVFAVMGGAVFGLVIGLTFPILLIFFMTRPRVIRAWDPQGPNANR